MEPIGSSNAPLVLKTSGPVYIEVQGHKYELHFKEVFEDAPQDGKAYVRQNGK